MNKKLNKKLITYLICMCMSMTAIPVMAEATSEESKKAGESREVAIPSVSPNSWAQINSVYLSTNKGKVLDLTNLPVEANTTVQIPTDVTNLTIKGVTGKTFNKLTIQAQSGRGTALSLTIQDLSINQGSIDIATNSTGDSLYILGNNNIVGANEKAAINIPAGKTLTINAIDKAQVLTAQGGSKAAGIGSGYLSNGGAGNIIINNGNIYAKGKDGGAGIGQGMQPNGSPSTNISILGGTIIADGGYSDSGNGGAGIGGSYNGEIGKILISGPTTVVTAKGGNQSAGIGAGSKKCESIEIKDNATILEAIGKAGGAGIGGGEDGAAKVNIITISSGTIEQVTGSYGAAGIGGGHRSTVDKIHISGGTFKSILGGAGAAGIGSGCIENVAEIIISGQTIIHYVQGGEKLSDSTPYGGAAIGGGYQRGVNLTINGDVVIEKAKGGDNTGAIGGGAQGSGLGNIKIDSGKIYAEAGNGTIYNDIGGSLERENSIDVSIGNAADVFIGNNEVRKIDDETKKNRANYIFQCYDKDDNQMIGYDFIVKSVSDPKYELKPSTDAYGNGYAWLKKIDVATQTFGDLGYYFKIVDPSTNIVYIAKQAATATSIVTADGITQITIKVKFSEAAEEKGMGAPNTISGNGIVPYSLSQVGYEINLTPYVGTHQITNIKSELDLSFLTSDPTKFDLSKPYTLIVKENGVRKNALENKLKGKDGANNLYINKDAATNKIIINYPDEMKTPNKYEIIMYIPSELNNTRVDLYVRDEVEASHSKVVSSTTELTIKQEIPIDDKGNKIDYYYNADQVNNISVPYKYLTKIN